MIYEPKLELNRPRKFVTDARQQTFNWNVWVSNVIVCFSQVKQVMSFRLLFCWFMVSSGSGIC